MICNLICKGFDLLFLTITSVFRVPFHSVFCSVPCSIQYPEICNSPAVFPPAGRVNILLCIDSTHSTSTCCIHRCSVLLPAAENTNLQPLWCPCSHSNCPAQGSDPSHSSDGTLTDCSFSSPALGAPSSRTDRLMLSWKLKLG